MRSTLSVLTLLIATVAFIPDAAARFARPEDVPVDRLIKNVAAYVAENPDDANGYYQLGRVHYLAFVKQTEILRTYSEGDAAALPRLPEGIWWQERQADEAAQNVERRRMHVSEALMNLRRAISMDPKNGLYLLTHASLMDEAAEFAGSTGWSPASAKPPAVLKEDADDAGLWKQAAADDYVKAVKAAKADDAALEHQPIHGLHSLVSYEAGKSLLTLIEDYQDVEVADADKTMIEEHLATLDALPRGPVTPVIVGERAGQPVAELLAPTVRVAFDLDGTGRAQSWDWVQPQTGILVWDPRGTGQIDSGRQLFGNVTWWIFWGDGYAALDALDDNRDGQLTGTELIGIRQWTDANQDGVSQPGEVVDLAAAGITAIATRADSQQDGHPAASQGIRRAGGSLAPSYDWIAQPAAALAP